MAPLMAYDLYFNNLEVGGKLDSGAKFTGWYYLVKSSDKPVAAATMATGRSGDSPSINDVVVGGPDIAAVAHALDELAANNQVLAGSYEARLLRSQGIFTAIWLRSDDRGPGLIYLLAPVPPLEAGKLYTEDEFIKAILMVFHQRQGQAGFGG